MRTNGRFVAAVVLLVPAVASGMAGAGSRAIEGTVALNAGEVLLVESQANRAAVYLRAGTLLEGVSAAVEIEQGDRVSVEVRSRGPGYAVADRVTVRPRPATHGRPLRVPEDLRRAAAGAPSPGLVDCRSRRAYDAGHIPGSVHVRAPGAPLTVPCSGGELVLAGEDGYGDEVFPTYRRLAREGCDVSVLLGGIRRYVRSALPLETEPAGIPVSGAGPLVVVDVRSREEYARARLPGALNVPFETMTWEDFSSPVGLPPLLFYGTDSGDARAADAARRTLGWRFQKLSQVDGPVSYLRGGFAAWVAEGREVERGPAIRRVPRESFRHSDEALPEELELLGAAGPGRFVMVDLRNTRPNGTEGVLHVRLEDLPDRLGELPKGKELIVFCSQGIRSRIAVAILRANGFEARFTREPGTP